MVLGAAGWMDQFERECSGQESLRPNVSCKCCLVVDIVFDCQGNSKVPVISLFSGCGGLELGLSRSET